MNTLIVNTGFGYFKDISGNIIAKAELPRGKHSLKLGYEYVEIASGEALELIDVYIPPPSEERIRKEKIRVEIWKMAEDSLIEKGEIVGN